MLGEVGVELGGIVVFFTVLADHHIKFLQICLAKVVKLDLDSVEEGFGLSLDPLHGFLCDVAVESGDEDDLPVFVDMVPGAGGKQPVSLSILLKLV